MGLIFLALSLSLFCLFNHVFSIVLLEPCVPLHCNTLTGLTKAPLFSASSKTITFYNKDTRGEIQRAAFNEEQVKRIFHGSFHKVNTMHGS